MNSSQQLRRVISVKFSEFQLDLTPNNNVEPIRPLQFIPNLSQSKLPTRSKSVCQMRRTSGSGSFRIHCDSKLQFDSSRNHLESKLILEQTRPMLKIKSQIASTSSPPRPQTQRSEQKLIKCSPNFGIWPFNSENNPETIDKITGNKCHSKRLKPVILMKPLNNNDSDIKHKSQILTQKIEDSKTSSVTNTIYNVNFLLLYTYLARSKMRVNSEMIKKN